MIPAPTMVLQYRVNSSIKPDAVDKLNAIGKKRVRQSEVVIPGIAPKIRPTKMLTITTANNSALRIRLRPLIIDDNSNKRCSGKSLSW